MTPNGYDEPNFNRRGFCVHCADYEDCELVEDNPVCYRCFDKYYNEDWTPRVTASDLCFEPAARYHTGGTR